MDYICGYLSRKFLKMHKDCQQCMDLMVLPKSDRNFKDYKLFTIMQDYSETDGLNFSTEPLFLAVQA